MAKGDTRSGAELAPRDDVRWRAVLLRDRRYDGAFAFAVRSTGIYCRPSCPARRARRDRVAFYDGPSGAEAFTRYEACSHLAKVADGPAIAALLASDNADARLAGLIVIDIANYEAEFEASSLARSAPVGVSLDVVAPTAAAIRAAVLTNPLSVRGTGGGKLLKSFIKGWTSSFRCAVLNVTCPISLSLAANGVTVSIGRLLLLP